jgi:hypothetical protein
MTASSPLFVIALNVGSYDSDGDGLENILTEEEKAYRRLHGPRGSSA